MDSIMQNEQDKILECKDLRVSFKTMNGTVKAVRGVSFNLYRGRTLAIVGESGSGKSVTSKAIMGILAGNKIIEDGNILFDGHDLLKLTDREFTNIRGSRISMIFQDPMSSLNPIMRVGKQMTEALILKNKSVRENSGKTLHYFTRDLKPSCLAKKPEDAKLIEEIFATMIKEHRLDEEKTKYITELFSAVSNDIFAHYLKSVEEVLIDLKNAQEKYLTSFETFDEKAFKEYLATLSGLKKKANIPLSESKDDLVFTFVSSCNFYLKNLKQARKDVAQDEKAKAKRAEAIAKGKKTDRDDLKLRSFGSEILSTPKDAFNKIKQLFSEFVDHLEEALHENRSDASLFDGNRILALMLKHAELRKRALPFGEAKNRAIKILEEVGIQDADRRYRQYPFELSGGMRQRIVIAISLLSNPDILICDEPTTALDVTIQAQILDLINKIKAERKLSIIFITHNLGVVANMADDVAVMYAGKIVEFGGVNDIFYRPQHPYTWALLSSMPDLTTKERLESIPGTPPNMIIPPKGDAFAARNKYALKIDFEEEPPLFKVSEGHYAATWLLHEMAPQVTPPKIVLERMAELQKYTAEQKRKGNLDDGK